MRTICLCGTRIDNPQAFRKCYDCREASRAALFAAEYRRRRDAFEQHDDTPCINGDIYAGQRSAADY